MSCKAGEVLSAEELEAALSDEARRRTFGSLRSLVSAYQGAPGVIGLHGGLPPETCFPLAGLSFTLADGRAVALSAEQVHAAPRGRRLQRASRQRILS